MSDIRNPERPARNIEVPPAPRPGPTAIAGAVSALLMAVLFVGYGLAQGLLFIVALGLGVALYHARFGFTSAFRQLMAVGQGQTLRAHMLMLAVASLLFAPLMALGTTAFGGPLAGYVFPIGLSVAFGGFIFCIGMQLGGACRVVVAARLAVGRRRHARHAGRHQAPAAVRHGGAQTDRQQLLNRSIQRPQPGSDCRTY